MIENITANIKLINGKNNAKYPYSNSLLIEDNDLAIIDTCPGKKQLSSIPVEKVGLVINTHFHFDHTRNNRHFKNAQVYMHHLDAKVLKSPDVFRKHTGLPHFEDLGLTSFFDFKIHELADNDIINVGNTAIKVVHTPGHCAGHCSFYFEKEDILFSGDIDLTTFGPWYGNNISSIDQFIASVNKLIDMQPGCLVSSHSGIVRSQIKEKLLAYLQIIERRDEQLISLLKRPLSLQELVDIKPIFRKHPDPKIYQVFEHNMVQKHLDRLINRNEVSKLDNNCYIAV